MRYIAFAVVGLLAGLVNGAVGGDWHIPLMHAVLLYLAWLIGYFSGRPR